MSGDWQPGDLALCVNDAPNPVLGRGPLRRGRIYTVRSAIFTFCPLYGWGTGLLLDEAKSLSVNGFASSRFRKIRPLTDEEREAALRELNPPVRELQP